MVSSPPTPTHHPLLSLLKGYGARFKVWPVDKVYSLLKLIRLKAFLFLAMMGQVTDTVKTGTAPT